jgi:hypothetical protein
MMTGRYPFQNGLKVFMRDSRSIAEEMRNLYVPDSDLEFRADWEKRPTSLDCELKSRHRRKA